MFQRLPRYAPLLLSMAIVAAAGCGGTADTPTSPAAAAAPQGSITAEPASARPEVLASEGCFTRPAFAIRIWIRLHGGFFIRGLRFHFIDAFGTRTLPLVVPILTPSNTSSIPSSSPVPVPGIAALPSPFQAGGSSPFFVRFGCGVIPDGTLFINADHDDGTVALKVRIADR